ncbi:hypothetical protein OU798_09520 [Prolixibacteraceae bacterium Z1-6]|uniref:Uncharacterized protein n=1 Tax=Draconibacterium aestuarii TaxID=2998507 RepID=A0A9X3F5A6_9BACT|nr:hypothetical protein [Prolixibacteraceae bacterium Z1-6]
MGLVVVPLKEDKVEAWKSWTKKLAGEKKEAFDDMNKRLGLERHDAWFAETPSGPVVVVLHEGPGAETFMQNVAKSDNSFDVWMKESIEDFHGMKLGAPLPGPMPVKMI